MTTASNLAAFVACLLVVALAIFQILLAVGRPLGRAAFGGKFLVLPKQLRFASGVSALLFVAALYSISRAPENLAAFATPRPFTLASGYSLACSH